MVPARRREEVTGVRAILGPCFLVDLVPFRSPSSAASGRPHVEPAR